MPLAQSLSENADVPGGFHTIDTPEVSEGMRRFPSSTSLVSEGYLEDESELDEEGLRKAYEDEEIHRFMILFADVRIPPVLMSS